MNWIDVAWVYGVGAFVMLSVFYISYLKMVREARSRGLETTFSWSQLILNTLLWPLFLISLFF